MKNKDIQMLEHINTYCEDISELLDEYGRVFETFLIKKSFHHAVSMCALQIGELTVNLSNDFKDATNDEVDWKRIKEIRNRFVHAYKRTSMETIWKFATVTVPEISQFIDKVFVQNKEALMLPKMEKSSLMAYLKKAGTKTKETKNQPQPTKKPDPER